MVGDSLSHDIAGARRVGMRGVLVHRSGEPAPASAGVPVIRSLTELPALLGYHDDDHEADEDRRTPASP
jgi:FMN phosphatase YigB (HAD superfamily)